MQKNARTKSIFLRFPGKGAWRRGSILHRGELPVLGQVPQKQSLRGILVRRFIGRVLSGEAEGKKDKENRRLSKDVDSAGIQSQTNPTRGSGE